MQFEDQINQQPMRIQTKNCFLFFFLRSLNNPTAWLCLILDGFEGCLSPHLHRWQHLLKCPSSYGNGKDYSNEVSDQKGPHDAEWHIPWVHHEEVTRFQNGSWLQTAGRMPWSVVLSKTKASGGNMSTGPGGALPSNTWAIESALTKDTKVSRVLHGCTLGNTSKHVWMTACKWNIMKYREIPESAMILSLCYSYQNQRKKSWPVSCF